MDEFRVPPQALDIERSLLGAMMVDSAIIDDVVGLMRPEYFYKTIHREIYKGLVDMHSNNMDIDPATLDQYFLDRGGDIGFVFLSELMTSVASSSSYRTYIDVLKEKYRLRRLIDIGGKMMEEVYDGEGDSNKIVDHYENDLFQLSLQRSEKEAEHIIASGTRMFDRIQAIRNGDRPAVELSTGYRQLDRMTAGWERGDLIIIAGRPSMGKSAFVICSSNRVSRQGIPVGVFSLEMSAEQYALRHISLMSKMDMMMLRQGAVNDEEWGRVAYAYKQLKELPLHIDDTSGLNEVQFRAKARRMVQKHGVKLIIIDYMQLMECTEGENRNAQITKISRSIKTTAKELDIPIIALSQMSRASEQRGGSKRPELSDLRESGCLAGDTLVYIADSGRYVPIKELVGMYDFPVLSIDTETWKVKPAMTSRAFCTGTKETFRLKTNLGRYIDATASHKFLTIDGWKRLDQLSIGEHIAVPRVVSGGDDNLLSSSELALLAHLIGDGCTLPRHSIQYTTSRLELANFVMKVAVDLFGSDINPRIKKERNWYQVYLASTRHHTHGVRNPVAEWMDRLGVFGFRSKEKRVPDVIFRHSPDKIALFLKHLWSTDGCIRFNNSTLRIDINYSTSSKRLAYEVQSLLLRLGINARIDMVNKKNTGLYTYNIIISGKPDVMLFINIVGAADSNRSLILENIKEYIRVLTANTNRDIIPKQVWRKYVVPAMADSGITGREMQKEYGVSYCGTSLYKCNIGRDRASRIADIVSSDDLRYLSNSDVYWDKIKTIEYAGEQDVFDLTVPGPHNFVANNIIVHNSIEQDADVVMFTHRPEYYGQREFEDHTSTENMAEIIIKKQRNGPVDTLRMRFWKKYAGFFEIDHFH